MSEDKKNNIKDKRSIPPQPASIPGLSNIGDVSEEKWKIMTRHFRIGEHMLQRKLITVTQLAELLDEQERTGEQLGELVVKKNILTRKELLDLLKWQHQADQVIMNLLIDIEEEPKE